MTAREFLRRSIDDISTRYKAGTYAWLEGKNHIAMKQIDALQEKIDALLLDGHDDEAAIKTIRAWKNQVIFWSENFKRIEGRS